MVLEVVFRGGDYYFEKSLVFNASDSGVEGRTVTYRAYENEEVKFKGSKKLDLSKATNECEAGSFTTLSTTIENIAITDEGVVTADIYAYGDAISGTVNAVCYIAAYGSEGQTLLEVVPQEMTLEVGKKYSFTGAFEEFDKSKTYSVRMYVWTDGYIPIVDKAATIIIPKEEQ